MDKTIAADIDALVGEGVAAELSGAGKDMAFGALEDADRYDGQLNNWTPAMRSADAEILPTKILNDSRVRDLASRDGYVQAGAQLQKDNIVGTDFFQIMRPEMRVLGITDETWEKEFKEEVEAKSYLAFNSRNKWIDASRNNTLTELIRLGVGVYCAGGEVLATGEWIKDDRRRPFRSAIQMVDTDRLSTPYEKQADNTVRGGVHLNRRGEHLGYHIREAHPSDFDRAMDQFRWKYVKKELWWGRPQVLFIREQNRPDQTRAVGDIVAGLKTLQITSRFRDVTLQNAVVNAMYAATFESEIPEAAFQALGAGNVGKSATSFANNYLNGVAAYAKKSRLMQINGVKIPHLYPGQRLQLRPAGSPGGVGQDFEAALLRHLATILGVSYEQLSRDYTKTNYSSARAAMVEVYKFMMSRKKLVADQIANFALRLWFEEVVNLGQIEAMKYSKLPSMYEGMYMDAYLQCDWIGAARQQIDELKETQAAALRIKYKLSTLEDELALRGKDWRKVLAQLEREQKELEERGLTMEVDDNMMNATTGEPREEGDQRNAA